MTEFPLLVEDFRHMHVIEPSNLSPLTYLYICYKIFIGKRDIPSAHGADEKTQNGEYLQLCLGMKRIHKSSGQTWPLQPA